MRVAGALLISVVMLSVATGLRSSGWPVPVRAVLVVLPALYWAAALAAAIEGSSGRARLDPGRLSLIGALTVTVAELLALSVV